MANNVKKILASGKAVMNGWLVIPSGFSAEVMAQCGFDSITVDLQHGVQDYQSMVQCLQAMQAHSVTPLVRVTWNEPGNLGKVLDAGAMGVICPMINTKGDAEAFVSACKYPPLGTRSNGPVRAAMYGPASGYQSTANDETLCIPIIETKTAIENLDAILGVEGVAGVYIGPTDLCFSYGLPPELDVELPQILKIYDELIKKCSKRNIFAGIHCASAAYAARAIGMGFRMTSVMNDGRMMAACAKAVVAQVRKESKGLA
ncbi:MAG: HpcH/HpaI aldolase/citrate lyase family protein [Reyranellales bacterium]